MFNAIAVKARVTGFALVSVVGSALFAYASNSEQPMATQGTPGDTQTARETEYLQASDTAMKTMMRNMSARPTGDVDRDFVAQMIPHHQGAIDMASALLHTGSNETLRRLAQEIIVTQRDEIAAMKLAIGEESTSGSERNR